MIFSAFLVSTGQLLWKLGGFSINGYLIIGLILYLIGFLCMIVSFKTDELSKLYPLMSLSYIFATMYSYFYLSIELKTTTVVGIFLIISGVVLMGRN